MAEPAQILPITTEPPEETKVAEEAKEERAAARRDWWPLVGLRRDLEHTLADLYRGPWRLPFTRTAFDVAPIWPGDLIWGTHPAVEIVETDQQYVLTAEMPGVQAGEVEVSVAQDRLTIKGEKKEAVEEDRTGVHVCERRYGAFERTFRIPEGVDAEKIEASFANGVLTVALPKAVEAPPSGRKIDVKAA